MSSSQSPPESRENSGSPTISRHPCVTCQRRKVRCDRKTPCTRCFKSGQECTQPEVFRAPRRPRRTQEANVLDRVKQLEESLEMMRRVVSNSPEKEEDKASPSIDAVAVNVDKVKVEIKQDPLEDELGRLIIEEERSRYVSGSAWQNLADQVGDLRTLLEDDGTNEDESPNSQQYIANAMFLSGNALKIPYSQTGLAFLWQTYVLYVDPCMKVIHVPSMQPIIDGVLSNVSPPSKSTEALLAAIKFGAVTSLSDEDCWVNFSTSREILLDMFKSEVQATLNAANFLSHHDISTLQAFVMFLFCNRRREQPQSTWISIGIAIRLAQSIGLHRDGAIMKLPILTTEICRRLFWEIKMLDLACAEDCGFLPTHVYGADTRLPTHCNDSDLHAGTTEPPLEREEFTDMTFSMTRYELVNRLHGYSRYDSGVSSMGILTGDTSQSLAVRDFISIMTTKYLPLCNPVMPLQRLTAKVVNIILAKISLISQYPLFRSTDRSSQISFDLSQVLFNRSCEIIELSDELFRDPETRSWSWMMATYVHWHSVVYILNELVSNPRHPQVEKAWRVLDMAAANLHGLTFEANLALWKPLSGLFERAKLERQRAGVVVDGGVRYVTPPVNSGTMGDFSPTTGSGASMDMPFMPERNLVPQDESLMAYDLNTPFATMSDFMMGTPDSYGVEQNWWMNNDMNIPGAMDSMMNPRNA